jgi:hypothetical protein
MHLSIVSQSEYMLSSYQILGQKFLTLEALYDIPNGLVSGRGYVRKEQVESFASYF